jgi:hypothetical protein
MTASKAEKEAFYEGHTGAHPLQVLLQLLPLTVRGGRGTGERKME